MKALVTGGAGFIGSSLARALLEQGAKVTVLDNLITGREDNVPAGADLIRQDFRDTDAVKAAAQGIDVIFHQGAIRSVPRSLDDPYLSETCNVVGTLNILLGAEAAGVRRVVYASSSSVYGGSDGEACREDAVPDPRSPYALTKLTAERYCQMWTRLRGVSTVSLRYFNVYGPGQRPDSLYSAVFPAFISALVNGESPEIHSDGEQSRDFTFIDDVVRANIRAAEATTPVDGEVVNVAGGKPRTINEVFESISDLLGVHIEPHRVPGRAGDVRHSRADIEKAERLLGWDPTTDWDAGVAKTVSWFRDMKPATEGTPQT